MLATRYHTSWLDYTQQQAGEAANCLQRFYTLLYSSYGAAVCSWFGWVGWRAAAPLNDVRQNNIMVISEITFNGYFNFMRLPIYIITI